MVHPVIEDDYSIDDCSILYRRGKELIVTGGLIRMGRRVVFAEAEMTNEDGVLLARGIQTAVPVTSF
jgi:acyl-coenzyme A thioesterase PaaI-like protein